MKKVILCICTLMTITIMADAQNNKTKTGVKKETTSKNASIKKEATSPGLPAVDGTTILTSTNSNTALAMPNDSLRIADPTIQALNANAKGANIKLGSSGLIGVPKGTYGFANGKLVLYSNGATSTGTATGMGSVGTGTSPGAVGSFGPAMGVNGKNPYAGVGPYGTRIPLPTRPMVDSLKIGGLRK